MIEKMVKRDSHRDWESMLHDAKPSAELSLKQFYYNKFIDPSKPLLHWLFMGQQPLALELAAELLHTPIPSLNLYFVKYVSGRFVEQAYTSQADFERHALSYTGVFTAIYYKEGPYSNYYWRGQVFPPLAIVKKGEKKVFSITYVGPESISVFQRLMTANPREIAETQDAQEKQKPKYKNQAKTTTHPLI